MKLFLKNTLWFRVLADHTENTFEEIVNRKHRVMKMKNRTFSSHSSNVSLCYKMQACKYVKIRKQHSVFFLTFRIECYPLRPFLIGPEHGVHEQLCWKYPSLRFGS